jgi:molybdate transport system regulatory protein
MREFNPSDKKKKRARIQIPENPGNLSPELLSNLENVVKASIKDGYLSCPVAWGIANKLNISKISVGAVADKLGTRITNCQLGCFKVDKTPFDNSSDSNISVEIINLLKELQETDQLTCDKAIELARRHNLEPMVLANQINAMRFKIRNCQLGCF